MAQETNRQFLIMQYRFSGECLLNTFGRSGLRFFPVIPGSCAGEGRIISLSLSVRKIYP